MFHSLIILILLAVPDAVWQLNIDVPEEAKSVSLDNTEDRWWEQVELTKLILASNTLTTIADGIANFSALVVLDVRKLKLLIHILIHSSIVKH